MRYHIITIWNGTESGIKIIGRKKDIKDIECYIIKKYKLKTQTRKRTKNAIKNL